MTVAALTSTLELSRGAYGGVVTISAWYDYTLNKRGVPHGNEANNYVAGQPLGDQGFPTLASFDGITALDMYAYGSWDLGDSKLSARLGRQVVKWGKSLVLQGVDQVNPIDISTLRRPGTRLEEALIPVGILYGDLTLMTGTRIEAFYQFEWQATVLEPCGTYFSSIDALVSPDTPGSGCPAAVVNAPDSVGYPARQFVPLAPTAQPKDGGQFGVSVRQKVEPLDTEFALYAMNIHSRVPVLDGIRGVVTFQAQADATGLINPKGVWAYPEDIHIYGVSASSQMAGWALGVELSYTANLPVQISVGDEIAALLYPTLGVPAANWGPLGPRVLATPIGGELRGYDRASKTMLILNAVRPIQNVLGARNAVVAAEVGMSWASGLDESMLRECFAEDEVAVFGGEVEAAQAFSSLPFNHIVFTGSPAVGVHVMRAASANLTPVTLELGGKSPALVSASASVEEAAKRIAHGKTFNSGQICVSPDYALVPRDRVEPFVSAVADSFRNMVPTIAGNQDYTSIINDRHAQRLKGVLDDARAKGATVTACGDIANPRRMPLHIVTGVRDDMLVATEELFGPVLPVIPYNTLDEAIAYINARPRPLAFYPFGFTSTELERLSTATHAGGVTVDDWGWHVFNHDLPFGGIGNSGMVAHELHRRPGTCHHEIDLGPLILLAQKGVHLVVDRSRVAK